MGSPLRAALRGELEGAARTVMMAILTMPGHRHGNAVPSPARASSRPRKSAGILA